MAYWNNSEVNQQRDSKTVRSALTAHEERLFKNVLDQKAPEQAQASYANDTGELCHMFSMFH